jgi:imidazolonepropionase
MIFDMAKANGMKTRIHADEFKDSDGAAFACKMRCASADHLMHVSEKGIQRLAKYNYTIATLLPGTTIFLGKGQFAPARQLIDAGANVALGSDFNPGSCMLQSQTLIWNIAMQNCKMTLEEGFKAVTYNAAKAVRAKPGIGSIELDKKCDLLVWNLESLD